MDDSLKTLAHKVEKLEQNTATEHAQLLSTLTMAVEQSRKGAWEYSNKMKTGLEERISSLENVSTNFIPLYVMISIISWHIEYKCDLLSGTSKGMSL